MATNPAGLTDLERSWRPLSDQEAVNASARLEQAWARLTAVAPTVPADMDSGALTSELVASVITDAVLRVLRNPEGLRQESIDDYSWTRDSAVSAGALYFTDAELALLAARPARARSMPVTRAY